MWEAGTHSKGNDTSLEKGTRPETRREVEEREEGGEREESRKDGDVQQLRAEFRQRSQEFRAEALAGF